VQAFSAPLPPCFPLDKPPASPQIRLMALTPSTMLPLGTTDCAHTAAGAEVQYAENVDKNLNRLDAGQNIPGLYNNFALISQLSSEPAKDLIDPAQLPVDPKTCKPVYPHEYVLVNTVFEVIHRAGLRTAWSDKHAAYDILNGPSGVGIDDLFTPEVNSSFTDPALPQGPGPDFTKDNVNTQHYDALKVEAVLNWIAGHDHAGNGKPGTPAILGLNFQTVSTAQKLNISSYLDAKTLTIASSGLGGYVTDAKGKTTPGPVLHGALTFVDEQIGRLVQASDLNKTVFIVTAKHGQSPESRSDLTIIDDGAMIDALNAAWAAKTGSSATPLVAHGGVHRDVPGPRPREFPDFDAGNTAVKLDGSGAHFSFAESVERIGFVGAVLTTYLCEECIGFVSPTDGSISPCQQVRRVACVSLRIGIKFACQLQISDCILCVSRLK